MTEKEFFEMQSAYCHDRQRDDGYIHCGDCICRCDCRWRFDWGADKMKYCSNFTHIEDTYGGYQNG